VITGFNTDVKHAERVYHVQTEDRGIANPVIESLVYVGGEILMSKKSPYRDLITGDRVDEKALREMMDLQHRRVIEAIRRGRLDKGKIGEAPPDWADDTLPSTDTVSPAALAAVHAILAAPLEPLPGARAPAPAAASPAPPPVPAPRAAPLRVSTGQAPAVPPPAPPTVVAPRKPSSGSSPAAAASGGSASPSGAALKRPGSGIRSLDQVIVDYLASEAASEHLELSLTSDAELVSGGRVTLTLKATTSLTEKPLPGVHVSIRVVSTVRPPQILYRGVTASDGCVSSVCALPDIGTGNAALIIAASSPLGNNEIKQLIKKKKGGPGGA
jgi:hypothetical protein